ncbi:MAG TPA: hypothetical protein VF976_12300 [Gemmatimonadales bacterium]
MIFRSDTVPEILGHEADGTPILAAHRSPDGVQLVITCPYCGLTHAHGAVGNAFGAGNGHRLSHCADGASGSGYVLQEVASCA